MHIYMYIYIIPEYKYIYIIPDWRLILPDPLLTPGPHLIAVDVVEPALLVSYSRVYVSVASSSTHKT